MIHHVFWNVQLETNSVFWWWFQIFVLFHPKIGKIPILNIFQMGWNHQPDYIWSNYSDLTRPHPKWWFSKGNPVISGKPRLVKYDNLARLYYLQVFLAGWTAVSFPGSHTDSCHDSRHWIWIWEADQGGGKGDVPLKWGAKQPPKNTYGCFRKWWVETPKSSILIGFSLIKHPFWGYHYFWKHPYIHLKNHVGIGVWAVWNFHDDWSTDPP